MSLKIYKAGRDYARQRGIIIADTKFEFGLSDGKLILIDEVLTPDSSRFWPADQYAPGSGQPSFDKQFVRDYLETLDWDKTPPGPKLPADVVAKTSAKYLEAYERLTGGKRDETASWMQFARRRFSAIPAPRARAVGQHGENLRRVARQIHRLGGEAKSDGLEAVELKHLMAFLQHERERPLANEPKESAKRLSSESVYLEIAALRAFYRFAENEKLLPANVAENLSLPRRWKRLPKALTNEEIEIARAGNAGDAAKALRPGDSGTGLRFRPAPGRIEKPAAGATASGRRVHQCHWQGQQGARGAGGPQGRGGVEPLSSRPGGPSWSRRIRRRMFF